MRVGPSKYVLVRLETMSHGLRCLVRLIRLLLGPEAITDKVGVGRKIVILGVEFDIGEDGFHCRLSADKIAKWTKRSVYVRRWQKGHGACGSVGYRSY